MRVYDAAGNVCQALVNGKTLVGFVMASTDGSMVATVDMVFVAEAYRGVGIGRKLVSRLAMELRDREIYDIGVRQGLTLFHFSACYTHPLLGSA
jgi:GNAT superfamily N-acetyltransferase